MNIVQYIFSDLFITFSNFFIWKRLSDRSLNLKKFKTILLIVLMYVVTLLNYLYNNQFIRIFTITIISSFIIKYAFNELISNSIAIAIFTQFIYLIGETFFAVVVSLFFNFSLAKISKTLFGSISSNFIISLISILISFIPIFKKLLLKLKNITRKISDLQLIITSFIAIFISNILLMIVYYEINYIFLLLLITFLIILYFLVMMYSLREKNNYNIIHEKYNNSLTLLKEYEDILDKYRIKNHETKNQLLTIRNMISNPDKKTLIYIDSILSNKLKDDISLMKESTIVPAGGLRGLIYSKLLLMKDKNISYSIYVSPEIKNSTLIQKISDKTMQDICCIIGIFLDNSIECVEKLTKKSIDFSMFLEENNIVISISNNFIKNIDFDEIEKIKFSTKGDNRGYGLFIVKQLVDENKKFINTKDITNDFFTQTLKILI